MTRAAAKTLAAADALLDWLRSQVVASGPAPRTTVAGTHRHQ